MVVVPEVLPHLRTVSLSKLTSTVWRGGDRGRERGMEGWRETEMGGGREG